MRYLSTALESLTSNIESIEKYINDSESFCNKEELADIEKLMSVDIPKLTALHGTLISLKDRIQEKYTTDKFKYKNSVLYTKRIGKIIVNRAKEKTYYKSEDKYKQKQHTYYTFAMEIATENGIMIHTDKKQHVWVDRKTKERSIETIKEYMNREYFVNPEDVEVVEA